MNTERGMTEDVYHAQYKVEKEVEFLTIVNATNISKILKIIYGDDGMGFTAEIIPPGRYRICLCNLNFLMKQELIFKIVTTGVRIMYYKYRNSLTIGIVPNKEVIPLSILSSILIPNFGQANYFRIRKYTKAVSLPVSLMFMPYEWHGMYAYQQQVLCNEEDCEY